jgi:uncharacterized membrane protein
MYKGVCVYLYIMGDISDEIIDIYAKIGAPLAIFTTAVGFFSGVFGEFMDDISPRGPNSAITSFVNITGCTFIGLFSGFFWPFTMPVISIGAIYNKYNNNKRIPKKD